ncbi:DUF6287 domain-containing protein [Lactobacillus taiwanensis]|uniref:DUF6287 domain-containing protein n=1 Tax=Lactobacillus taiwanensis TaxID=508451 RepID=UPI00070F2935|nr:DUF6287 domain-containing protein [Lactobacillus taiwanensis]
MKKSISIATGLLSLLLIVGCSNKNKSNSNASQESSKSTISSKKQSSKETDADKMDNDVESKSGSTEKSTSFSSHSETISSSKISKSSQSSTDKVATKKMNFDQIQNGDYSSLVGNWKLIKAVGRHKDVTDRTDSTLTITPSLLKTHDMELSKDGLTDSNDTHPIEVKKVGDALNIINSEGDPKTNGFSQYNWGVTFYPANSQNVIIDGEKQAPISKNLIAIWVSSDNYTEVFEEE